MFKIQNSPSFVAPSFHRKVSHPNWDYRQLPQQGQCWLIRTDDFQNPPAVCFLLRIEAKKKTVRTANLDSGLMKEEERTKIIYEFAATYINKKKSSLYIKNKDKESFANVTIQKMIQQGVYTEANLNGATYCPFVKKRLSESYLTTQISKKRAVRLNDDIKDTWSFYYIQYKFIVGNEGEDNTWVGVDYAAPQGSYRLPSK